MALPERESVITAIVFGPPLGAVLALVACLGLGLANLLDRTPIGEGLRRTVPLSSLIGHPSDLVPVALVLSFALGVGLVFAAHRGDRARGSA